MRNKRDSTHKGQAHSEIGPTSYGFVRIIAQMTKLASIRSSLISPVTLTSKCATIDEHEESILCMTSPHVKRLSPVTRWASSFLNHNHCLAYDVGHIVIGVNEEWKQEVNLGKRNNQNFVMLPHGKFVEMIRYKAEDYGIWVTVREERKLHVESERFGF